MDERLAPIVYTVPLQLFAYHVSVAKFRLAELKAG
jgi:glucosamine 6-phosphate synthetase-like amidotransferase/phosphosugar isomerase protein